ncbi:heavy metal-binding domain-containing protein [Frankia sp. Cppng1_Ct_nod]|uniref:heavy metal-binding domain-containing protein n=1 Tax=Frankia sp. Cppng1_Ct_nod TaxID=2897162 RepID=UPI00104105E5|nr:heavy metal-binding domain-containing protein [Frankia sp. Cppng1_Ct_nod]
MTPTPQDSIIDLPISTTFDLPGFTVERTLGLSWRLIVRSVGTVTGGLRALRAGEVPRYTEVVNAARRTALERLVEHARELGGRDRGRVRPGLGGSGVQPRAG